MPRFASGLRPRALASIAAVPLLVISAAGAGLIAVSHPEWYRGALAIAIATNLVILGMKWPRAAALATLLFLPFLALTRRLLIADAGFESNDPLLLVGPVVALFLLYRLYVVEGRRDHDRLFKLMVALLAVTVLQVFNPFATGGPRRRRGGPAVRRACRCCGSSSAARWATSGVSLLLMYGTIVVACVVGDLRPDGRRSTARSRHGTRSGWTSTATRALHVGDSGTGSQIRPFSTFSSNQEYAAFLRDRRDVRGRVLGAAPVQRRRRASAAHAGPLSRRRPQLARDVRARRRHPARAADALVAGRFVVVMLGIAVAYGAASTFGPRIDRAAGLGGDARRRAQRHRHPPAAGPGQVDA